MGRVELDSTVALEAVEQLVVVEQLVAMEFLVMSVKMRSLGSPLVKGPLGFLEVLVVWQAQGVEDGEEPYPPSIRLIVSTLPTPLFLPIFPLHKQVSAEMFVQNICSS